MEPIMVATVGFVFAAVFHEKSDAMMMSLKRMRPEWLRDWLTHAMDSASANGVSSVWQIAAFLALIPLVFLIRGVVGYLNIYLLQWVSMKAITDFRVKLFNHLLNLPASFFTG